MFDRIEGVFGTLFWALFGHVELSTFKTSDHAQITEVTGHLLFATYSLASVLVALNLLIAMLSNTYKKVDVSFIYNACMVSQEALRLLICYWFL